MGSASLFLNETALVWKFRAAVLIGLLCSSSLSAAPSGRVDSVQRFVAARKRGDLAAARQFLAPDARSWFNQKERKGPGEPWTLQPDDWERWDLYFRGETEYSDWKEEGEAVSAIGHEINDYYRLLDWQPKPLSFTWVFDSKGKISGFSFHEVGGLPPARRRLEEFKEWAKSNRPDELSYLMPRGVIDPSGDRPPRWRTILVQWREAIGLPAVPLPDANPLRVRESERDLAAQRSVPEWLTGLRALAFGSYQRS